MHPPDTARRSTFRTPFWSNRLWFLAAVLGATSIYYMAAQIHDRTQAHEAVHLVARSMADHVAALGSARFDVLAEPTFAPVDRRTETGLDDLVRAQRDAIACHCREVLPVAAFFALDQKSGGLHIAPIVGGDSLPVAQERIASVAARDVPAGRDTRATSRTHVRGDPSLGAFTITTFVPGEYAKTSVLYGAITRTDTLMGSLFGHHLMAAMGGGSGSGLAHLDTLSLHVATTDSGAMFGMLGDNRQYRATVPGRGALSGVAVTIALKPSQLQSPLLLMLPHNRLWRVGVLLLCTVVVVVIAYGSSRRELLLARARSDFVAGVSHDLRMPLAQILLAGETLALDRARDAEEGKSLANSIVREARRLNALVDNVLFFSRSGAVAPTANMQDVDVDGVFTDVAESVALAVRDAGQVLEVVSSNGIAVRADTALLRQAIVNLVDNAMKYGKEGQRISLSAQPATGDNVHINVDDEGNGVPSAERARVFEAYERLEHDQVSERTGSGLGLAVVRQIVRACGGDVWLDEAPGGGTRAVIELTRSAPSRPT